MQRVWKKKRFYLGERSGKIKDVVGMDQIVELPKNTAVRIIDDGSREPAAIIEKIAPKLRIGEKN